MVGNILELKAEARREAFARRKVAHSGYDSQDAAGNLLEFLMPHRGNRVAAYMPIRTEIDVMPVMREVSQHCVVGVPVILGRGQPLEFRRWQPGTEMQDGPFGARIPKNAELVVPQVVILPLVAFDKLGFRLGYGGGFYDRTLEVLRANGPVLAVGFAYAAQEADSVPIEPTDQIMNAIVTEKGIRWFDIAKPTPAL